MDALTVFEILYADSEMPGTDYIVVSKFQVAAAVMAAIKRPVISLTHLGRVVAMEPSVPSGYEAATYSEANGVRPVENIDGCDCSECTELRDLLSLNKKKTIN